MSFRYVQILQDENITACNYAMLFIVRYPMLVPVRTALPYSYEYYSNSLTQFDTIKFFIAFA